MTEERHKAKPEEDVDHDDSQVTTKATESVPKPKAPDQGTPPETTPSREFVGRVAGDEGGDDGETGADRRAKQDSTGDG